MGLLKAVQPSVVMRLMVGLATTAAVLSLGASALGEGKSSGPGCMTMKEYRRHSALVWSPDRWQRGDPKPSALRAQRRALACAGASEREAMQSRWRQEKARYYQKRSFCRSGPKVEGRVSVYSGGTTGDGIHSASEPGIAIRSTATYGSYYRVHVQGSGTAMLMHFDYGPATWTGRSIDITLAGAAKLGGVTTDNWGVAKLIPNSCL